MDFTSITDGIKALGDIVTSVFDFFGKGKLDQTKAMELNNAFQTKVRELEGNAYELQIKLTEKLMVGASWTKPLALITGIALVSVCVFNIVAPAFNLQAHALAIDSVEVLILLGLFMYVTTGSSKVLLLVVEYVISKWSNRKQHKEEQK